MQTQFRIRQRITLVKQLCRGISRFVLVGTAAAAVHWSVVVILVEHVHWRPLVANIPGWLVAFSVSFTGHYFWTFRHESSSLASSAGKFFAVSACGFFVNEMAYALLLSHNDVRYDLVLAAVLIAVAGMTYLASRYWAFRRTPKRQT